MVYTRNVSGSAEALEEEVEQYAAVFVALHGLPPISRASAGAGPSGKKGDKSKGQNKAESSTGGKKGGKRAVGAANNKKKEPEPSTFVQPPKDPLVPLERIAETQYGYLETVCSSVRTGRVFTELKDLNASLEGQTVTVRSRIHNSRSKGNQCFLVLRSGLYSGQASMFVNVNNVDRAMLKFAASIPRESVVDVRGIVVIPPSPLKTVTQGEIEISVMTLHVVSQAKLGLPLGIEDASRPVDPDLEESEEGVGSSSKGDTAIVGYRTRLDNRVLDLRVPAHVGIFRIQHGVCCLFREFLTSKGFVEIHTPKILGSKSEGGAEVFELGYFGGKAYLAQSPQLYKEMAVMGDLMKVFEIAPVFRAENSNSPRHLTEFMGLDLEMPINEHFHEVLDLLEEMLVYLIHGIVERFPDEIDAVSKQYGSHPITVLEAGSNPRMTFREASAFLAEHGHTMNPLEDIDSANEKLLGQLVREKYGSDLMILSEYPASVRPFYTMPSPTDPNYTNSFDVMLRGQEIASGAQRVHDPDLLVQRMQELNVDPTPFQAYIDSFRYGAWPHGGAGFGLERIVNFLLGVGNVRRTSMFPRTPSRVFP